MAVKEVMCSGKKRLHIDEQFAVGDFAPQVPPEHLNRIEPRAVGRQVEQHEPSSRAAYYGFDLIIFMSGCIIPCDIDRTRRMLVQQSLQKFSHFLPPFTLTQQNDGLARVVVDRAKAIMLRRLTGCANHDLLAPRTPHGAQRRKPTQVELVCIVKDVARG